MSLKGAGLVQIKVVRDRFTPLCRFVHRSINTAGHILRACIRLPRTFLRQSGPDYRSGAEMLAYTPDPE